MTDTSDTPEESVSGDVIGAPDVSGEWLPPGVAAVRLGVSERTLWRHITAGRYHKRTVSGRTEVLVPGSGAVSDKGDSGAGLAMPDADRQMSLAVIAELRRRLDAEADRQRRLSVKTERQAQEIGRLQAERDTARQAAEAALEAAEARAEQAVIDYGEQFERAVRAEAEIERLRRRRWWWPWSS